MSKYEVTTNCHVPVGPGFKYKKAGQVVELDDVDAAELAPFLTPLEDHPAPKRAKSKATKDLPDEVPTEDTPDDVPDVEVEPSVEGSSDEGVQN